MKTSFLCKPDAGAGTAARRAARQELHGAAEKPAHSFGNIDCFGAAVREIRAAHELLNACDYEPIADYGVIGNCRSGALVSRQGSIDWLCLPDFSAPSTFAAILDRRRGGRFLIRPRDIRASRRRYVGDSAVLETVFQCADGVARLTDCLAKTSEDMQSHRLLRLLECLQGTVRFDVVYQPRPDYGRRLPGLEPYGETGWIYREAGETVLLLADTGLAASAEGSFAAGAGRLAAGERQRFALVYGEFPGDLDIDLAAVPWLVEATVRWWEGWCRRCVYQGPYGDAVSRSLMTLKLLAHQRSGAVMAALTTSLPESFSAARNWDYRYCWLRDTSLLLQSFIDLGFERESAAFLDWLLHVTAKPHLQPLYDLAGQPVVQEYDLPHLEGYRGCGPVRIGNDAHQQLQLDIYGEVMQTAYRFAARGGRLSAAEKRWLASLGEAVCHLWREPDQSIWETRGPPRHYTYSKLMCWVALDRLLALSRCLPLALDAGALAREREQVRLAIETRGFNGRLGSYVGYFGGSEPDASLLLMVRYRYLPPGHPRIQGTYRHIMARLAADGLLYRYPPGRGYDGIAGPENLFVVCSFWAVDYLARSGQVDQARGLFERLLGLANDLGLYAEQYDLAGRQALGNFPQAFSHSGLVTAALAIDQALRGRPGHQIAA